jgi:hypothetical protein
MNVVHDDQLALEGLLAFDHDGQDIGAGLKSHEGTVAADQRLHSATPDPFEDSHPDGPPFDADLQSAGQLSTIIPSTRDAGR